MSVIWANQALTARGWERDLRVGVGSDGRIASIKAGQKPEGHRLDVLLAAPANSHSHAFQRAMAGLTESRGENPTDSFWTWRDLMYRFLDQISPDQVQAIAALVQMEMLEAGYATNVEFHYLHHSPNGTPFDNLSEMSDRIAAAAETTGIGLTLLPVQYQFGGCDGRPLGAGQRRFGNEPDRFARLVEAVRTTLQALPADTNLGVAPHSLRGVAPEQLRDAPGVAQGGPVHLHLAEQVAEVDEVQATWGARPVEWVLDNLPLDGRWCMIHCTQMQPHETAGLARSGAVAGLCPITEASLGDGIFDGVRWLDAGGKISVGSDSNILISLSEELRVLDTTQRLRDHTRSALADGSRSTGRHLFDGICTGGAQAAGRGSGTLAVGEWADLLALDMGHIDLAGLQGDTIIDAFAFTGTRGMVADVWSAGRHMVQGGAHIHHDQITRAYSQAVRALRDGV